jgi:SAM-dependent methyltransferase
MTDGTVDYYDRNADRFEADTADLDMGALHDRFLHHVRPGGRILDAGCGVGRDTLAFVERGFSVVAFDASAEMVRRARARLGGRAEVLQMCFEDVAWRDTFDGIWACASLLHVPASTFPDVARRLAASLRPGSVCYMSFKYGEGERSAGGRLFTDHTEMTVAQALGSVDLVVLESWKTGDVRPDRPNEHWINLMCAREPSVKP